MVAICTTSLTFTNSTFCPHRVFVCFVWIWEQTAIISLYSINWLDFITCLTLESPVVTICTAGLTFTNSTFCPHSVFVCFVWFWEQTAIISLYNINWLVCITETECVYCAVRTECLYKLQTSFLSSVFYSTDLTLCIASVNVLATKCVCVFNKDLRTKQ